MNKSLRVSIVSFALLAVVIAAVSATRAHAQGQYPILNMVADKVIAKYQQSTCEELWQRRSQPPPPSAEAQQLLGLLHSNPDMRAVFIGKVATPIASKMFECGLIP
jgi:hypothetical protein